MKRILLSLGLISAGTAAFLVMGTSKAEPTTRPAPSELRMRWQADTMVNAYDAIGMKDPKWDALARQSLAAAARTWAKSPRTNRDEDVEVITASTAALRAGCRDPMVIYARARSLSFYGSTPQQIVRLQKGMVEAFRVSKYPAIRKCFGLLRAAQLNVEAAPGDQAVMTEAKTLAEEAMKLLPEVFADPKIPMMDVAAVLDVVGDASEAVEKDRTVLRDRAIDVMQKSALPQESMLLARAKIAFEDGWRARGGDTADQVTPEGWRVLQARTIEARALLEKAWTLDPSDIEIAHLQLDCEVHDTHGRAAMEQWFTAANHLDPDDARPYVSKLNWLEPKWHGSHEEMLKFGRECAATGRWSGLVPMVLVDAHWAVGMYFRGEYYSAPHREYFANSPEIWAEIKPVYDRYLQEPDASNYHKTRYAVIAAYSGKWKEANALFTSLLPDRLHPRVLWSPNALVQLVEQAALESQKLEEAEKSVGGKSQKQVK